MKHTVDLDLYLDQLNHGKSAKAAAEKHGAEVRRVFGTGGAR